MRRGDGGVRRRKRWGGKRVRGGGKGGDRGGRAREKEGKVMIEVGGFSLSGRELRQKGNQSYWESPDTQ